MRDRCVKGIRFVMSDSSRSSLIRASAAALLTFGRRAMSSASPPFRLAARARMAAKCCMGSSMCALKVIRLEVVDRKAWAASTATRLHALSWLRDTIQSREPSLRIRSLLYVPVSSERFLAKAHERDADAIILDLEDAVAPARKDAARARLGEAVAMARRGGAVIFVRINSEPTGIRLDAEAACPPGGDGVVVR